MVSNRPLYIKGSLPVSRKNKNLVFTFGYNTIQLGYREGFPATGRDPTTATTQITTLRDGYHHECGKNGAPNACRFSNAAMFRKLRQPKLYMNFHIRRGEHSLNIREEVLAVAMYSLNLIDYLFQERDTGSSLCQTCPKCIRINRFRIDGNRQFLILQTPH